MTNKTKPKLFVLVGPMLLVAAVLAFGCGGGSGAGEDTPLPDAADATDVPAATLDGDATPGPDVTQPPEVEPTDDPIADETRRPIRELERSVRKLASLVRILTSQAGQTNRFIGDAEEEEEEGSWFSRCCEDAPGDFGEEFARISRELPDLIAIYEEADAQESLTLLDEIGEEMANTQASLSVLASLPTNETAGAILDDISFSVEAMAVAVSNLR